MPGGRIRTTWCTESVLNPSHYSGWKERWNSDRCQVFIMKRWHYLRFVMICDSRAGWVNWSSLWQAEQAKPECTGNGGQPSLHSTFTWRLSFNGGVPIQEGIFVPTPCIGHAWQPSSGALPHCHGKVKEPVKQFPFFQLLIQRLRLFDSRRADKVLDGPSIAFRGWEYRCTRLDSVYQFFKHPFLTASIPSNSYMCSTRSGQKGGRPGSCGNIIARRLITRNFGPGIGSITCEFALLLGCNIIISCYIICLCHVLQICFQQAASESIEKDLLWPLFVAGESPVVEPRRIYIWTLTLRYCYE